MKKNIFKIGLGLLVFLTIYYLFVDNYAIQDEKKKAIELTNDADNRIMAALLVEDLEESKQEYDTILNILNKAIEFDSTYLPAYTKKILVYEELKEYQNALNTTNLIQIFQGLYPELVLTQGILLGKLKRSKDAVIKFEKALNLFYKKISTDTSSIFNDKINICYLRLFIYGKKDALNELSKLSNSYPDKEQKIVNHKIIIENFVWDQYFDQ